MTSYETPETQTKKLRRADFKVALVLLVVVSALFVMTLDFPMSGSYGGVESQWYVSPALFPLLVLGVVLIAVLLLFAAAIRNQGYHQFFALSGWVGDRGHESNRDKWLVIALLCLYVYVYIPSIDFYLSSVIFLLSLTLRFYLCEIRSGAMLIAAHLVLVTALVALRYYYADEFSLILMTANDSDSLIRAGDSVAGFIIAAIIGFSILQYRRINRQIIFMLTASVLVPLVLVVVFSFLLYVPMPVEYGSVMNVLNFIVYDMIQG